MARRMYEESEEGRDLPDDKQLLPAAEVETEQGDPNTRAEVETSDRDELIQRIKRGERPTWVPKPGLEALITENEGRDSFHETNTSSNGVATSPTVIRALGIESQLSMGGSSGVADPIERPRSALHTGDFCQPSDRENIASPLLYSQEQSSFPTGFSASPPWLSSAPHSSLVGVPAELNMRQTTTEPAQRSRAPSLGSSLSSSFVLRVPTSPLVHAVNNTSLDFSQQYGIIPLSPKSANRRRTLPSEAFQSLDSQFTDNRPMKFSKLQQAPIRRETSLHYPSHQPRRSLNSFTYHLASSPQTPVSSRTSRPSFASEPSPIQHAAMVGSFEESILRGRMSTAPSKPLDFVAQIGVLGKGNCKPSLKCPAHVTVPFPAVFYSYSSTNASGSPIDDSPSPYVGSIDLEHNLRPVEVNKHRKRQRETVPDPDVHMADITAPENTAIGRALARDARRKEKRSMSPKTPTGGCYRVPQQGQLQIIIKNPNKTAVKLFLVPYDLEGMEAGTKTFVRQRSFTVGPILEKPLSGSPEARIQSDPLKDKQILRYLVHLKFCCPSKGRFYLYDNVRVVFANRVPDGKEKLRNEEQLPEPKYSPYHPGKDIPMGAAGAKLAAEKAFRRRSSGFGISSQLYDVEDGFQLDRSNIAEVPPLPKTAIPFHLPSNPKPLFVRRESDHQVRPYHNPDQPFNFQDRTVADAVDAQSRIYPQHQAAVAGFDACRLVGKSPTSWSLSGGTSEGRNYSPVPPEPGEGLLSKKFREHKEGAAGGESRSELK
jgi:Domain of unknown function (DUF4210)/Chromosome segregation during meiosis